LLAGDVAAARSDDVVAKVGKKILFKCDKSRSVVEGRKGEFWMNFETMQFALPEESLFNLATKLGVIEHPKTAVLHEHGPEKGQPKKDSDGNVVFKTNNIWWQFPAGAVTPQYKWQGAPKGVEALRDREVYNLVWQECLLSGKLDAAAG